MKRTVRFSYQWMMLAFTVLLGVSFASGAVAQQTSDANPLRPVKKTSSASVKPATTVGSAVRSSGRQTPRLVSHTEPSRPASRSRSTSTGVSAIAYPRRTSSVIQGSTLGHQEQTGGSVLNGTVTVQPEPSDVVEGGVYYEGGAESMMGDVEMEGDCNECMDGACTDCCLIPCPRIPWDDLTIFGGAQGFTGPKNLGTGSFGFHEGVNWGAPFPFFDGCFGMQAGARFTQANLSGSEDSPETRHQMFLTGGLFRRVDWGLQGGVAFDYLSDTWYTDTRLAQLRAEIGWVFPCGHELGFWMTHSLNEDSSPTQILVNQIPVDGNATWEATDLYAVYYRHRFNGWEGANCRLYAGFTGDADGYIGSDVQVPLSCDLALQAGFAYLVPEQTKGPAGLGNEQESWNVAVSLVWYPGCGTATSKSYFAPLFNVADNGSFMVDQLR